MSAESAPPWSLCERCENVRVVRSERGSVFLRCELEKRDPRFPKYPPQPVVGCEGFRVARAADDTLP